MLFVVLAFTLLLPVPGLAQIGGDDFLFRPSPATLSLRGGYGIASANSDLFDDATTLFTLEKSDFNALVFDADVGLRINDRFELVGGLTFGESSARSEYRDWVDQDDLPIEQDTRLTRVPVIAGVRYYLVPRGRSIGRFAWIPAKWAPYVGGGVGAVYYKYEQEGDFVDFETSEVFTATIESSGWGRTGQLFGGVQYSVSRRTALAAEARYVWASADPDLVFSDLGRIDLGGVQTTVGLSFRF
jgi:opacity protein-like surface antigen